MSSPYLPKTVRSFLKISIGMHWQRRKWAQLKSYKLGAKTVCREGLLQKAQKGGKRPGSHFHQFQLLCALPLALGIRVLLTRATACSSQAVYDTSYPVTWLSATEACVPFFVSRAGHTCRDRCPIWQGASKFQRSRGLDA